MIICFDFDDVICTHVAERILLAKKFGYKITKKQTHPSVMKEIMGRKKYFELAAELYTTYTPQALPSPGILPFLKWLKTDNRLIIITARGEKEKSYAYDWLEKYKMESHFDKIIFVSYQDKTPFLKQERAEVFIENSWNNLVWAPQDIIKILYNPWRVEVPISFPHFEAKNMTEMRRILARHVTRNPSPFGGSPVGG